MNDKNQIVTNDEMLLSNMVQLEAITRLLIKKEIITNDEFFQEIENVKVEIEEKVSKNKKMN